MIIFMNDFWLVVFREKDLRIGKNAQNNSYMYMLRN